MKLYQYQCRRCSHSFKRLFLIVQDAPFACPKCGDIRPKKILNYATLSPENGIGLWTGSRLKSTSLIGPPRMEPAQDENAMWKSLS